MLFPRTHPAKLGCASMQTLRRGLHASGLLTNSRFTQMGIQKLLAPATETYPLSSPFEEMFTISQEWTCSYQIAASLLFEPHAQVLPTEILSSGLRVRILAAVSESF